MTSSAFSIDAMPAGGKRGPLWFRLVIWGSILGILILVLRNNPGLVRFWPFNAAEFVQTMTPLILVSLFVERAVEIVIKGTRGHVEDRLKNDVKNDKSKQAELTHYKSDTRDRAFAYALVLCVAISALGVRALEMVIDPAVFSSLTDLQRSWFQVIDVGLTGALLAGGADGLHKIVSLFTDNIDALRKRAQGQP